MQFNEKDIQHTQKFRLSAKWPILSVRSLIFRLQNQASMSFVMFAGAIYQLHLSNQRAGKFPYIPYRIIFQPLDCTKLQKRLGVLEMLFTPVEISFPVFDSWAVQMAWRKYINGSFILETRHSHKFDRSKSTINRGLSNEAREKALINSARE